MINCKIKNHLAMTLAQYDLSIGILVFTFGSSIFFSPIKGNSPVLSKWNDVLDEIPELSGPNPKFNDVLLKSQSINLSSRGIYTQAAVASDAKICATIGRNILQEGGSAVDSAIATQVCDGVVNAHSMGIGGGMFMTIYDRPSESVVIIDAREVAPGAATQTMFLDNSTLSKKGGLAVAVPGELRGYAEAYRLYGRLPWRDLFEPTIQLCMKGFIVENALAHNLKHYESEIISEPTLRNLFINPKTKKIYKEGEIMKRPTLAKTLELIAENGADEFYSGEIARRLVRDIRHLGGVITEKDLHNYKALVKKPVKTKLHNIGTLYSAPPPSGGLILTYLLNILEGYHISPLNLLSETKETLFYHRVIEAMKFAYSKRTELGDYLLNLHEHIHNLTSKAFAKETRNHINDRYTFIPAYYGAEAYIPDDAGTAHTSVMDPEGSAVSMTSSINLHFGAFRASVNTGIILNNQMDDFSTPSKTNYFGFPPARSNFIRAGKRPMSSMAPSIILDESNNVRMVIGASGGSKIISAVAQALIRYGWLTENLITAVDMPRLHHQLIPNFLCHEEEFSQKLLQRLEQFGHKLKSYSRASSVIQAIVRHSDGTLEAVADGRKGGKTAGF